jgi:hypothetical protein
MWDFAQRAGNSLSSMHAALTWVPIWGRGASSVSGSHVRSMVGSTTAKETASTSRHQPRSLRSRFPLPFFDGVSAESLRAAPRFEFVVEAPWYLVSANGFDLQHFRCAHDRTLVDEPVLSSPHPFAWRLDARFLVTGHSWMDRVTRWFSGSSVEMTVTNWCGNLVLVAARFRRTTTYGLVSFIPLEGNRTWVRDIIWVPRRRWPLRAILDPIDARIRRLFIREFVKSDVERSAGIRYNPHRMIEADKLLVEYLAWLRRVQH